MNSNHSTYIWINMFKYLFFISYFIHFYLNKFRNLFHYFIIKTNNDFRYLNLYFKNFNN
jgi:hypothetical protein